MAHVGRIFPLPAGSEGARARRGRGPLGAGDCGLDPLGPGREARGPAHLLGGPAFLAEGAPGVRCCGFWGPRSVFPPSPCSARLFLSPPLVLVLPVLPDAHPALCVGPTSCPSPAARLSCPFRPSVGGWAESGRKPPHHSPALTALGGALPLAPEAQLASQGQMIREGGSSAPSDQTRSDSRPSAAASRKPPSWLWC